MTTTLATRRLACSCKLCATNAAYLGLPLPLEADWTPQAPAAAETLGRTGKSIHGLVYTAHDPTVLGRAGRAALGLVAVR